MISSTAIDLPKHREQVRLGCQRAGFPADQIMENLTALDADAVEVSLKMVEEADIYLGIYAHRYGYVPDGKDVSITEMEYNRAAELKKPRLIFFIHEDHPLNIKDVERGKGADKLDAFKERIGKERVAAFFKSAEDLRGDVFEALVALRKKLEGDEPKDAKAVAHSLHRRTAIPEPPEAYVAHPYTLLQTRELVGRQKQLNALTDWVATPGSGAYDCPIFCFVAIGGMGKSALTWKWFRDIAPEEMKPVAGRLWWSFYESDASFENFLNRALCYVSGREEDEVRDMAWHDREAELLSYLSKDPYLLVLDGLERILLAYHRMDAHSLADDDYDQQAANWVADASGLPSSAAQSFTGQHRLRDTIDPRAGAFLQKLSQVQASRVLISTRLYPLALQLPTRAPRPGCFAYFLSGLSDDDALGLWRGLGVKGARQELVPMFQSFESHPLLVQALAGEVARYRKKPGDFAAWRADHPRFDPASVPLEKRKSHILVHALEGLGKDFREILTTLVGFRMAATYDTLEALLVGDGKIYARVPDLDRGLDELEDRGLIGWDREASRYDAHPIVRSVVWELAGKEDKDAVYSALEAHFEPMAVSDWDDVTSLDDLAPAIERYHTLMGLGRYDDAWTLFRDRLADSTFYRLAAHAERIAWLEKLFPNGVDEAPILKELSYQQNALDSLAKSYEFSGQPGRALPLYRRANELNEQEGNKSDLANTMSNLGAAFFATGALREAAGTIRSALVLDRELGEAYSEGIRLVELGRSLSLAGNQESARLAFGRSQHIFLESKRRQPEGVVSTFRSELALCQADIAAASTLADRAWQLAGYRKVERDFIRAGLLQGRAALGSGDFGHAEERLHVALTRTRAVNVVEMELPALIAIAELEYRRERYSNAKTGLSDVWEAADRGPYPLRQADAFNVLADIARAEGDRDGAIDAATKGYRAAWCDGPPWAYHWGLEKAKAHLKALGAPEPEMPAFDESKFEAMPEVEINPKDKHWVDPDTLGWEAIVRDIRGQSE